MYSSEHPPKEVDELLGSYNSSLTTAYYQELLNLLDQAISSGDLSGGSAFDPSTLLNLENQAQSFASLPTGTAGDRVMDDSFNYPLSLLAARLSALATEAGNFTTVSGRLLDILANETSLVDDILAAGKVVRAVADQVPSPSRLVCHLLKSLPANRQEGSLTHSSSAS